MKVKEKKEEKTPYYDVLAMRYATARSVNIWSSFNKCILERQLWIAVLKAQESVGFTVPSGAISAYEKNVENVDLERIKEIEEKTRHDVKARIQAFNELAGFELIHMALTSRDLTDNVEQQQVKQSLEYIAEQTIAVLYNLGYLANRFRRKHSQAMAYVPEKIL